MDSLRGDIALRARAHFASVLLIASGCTAVPPAPQPPPVAQAPLPPAASAQTVDAAAQPSTSAEPTSAGSAAPAPSQALPVRGDMPGSTRGTIACVTARCDASKEVCAVVERPNPMWACVPKDQTKGLTREVLWCDDATDCPQGKTCCQSFTGTPYHLACTTRDVDCRVEVCEPDGAPCPNGTTCRDHTCVPTRAPGAQCGSVRCPEQTPYCQWKAGTGKCLTAEAAAQVPLGNADTGAVLQCTRNADCGQGFHCCTGGEFGQKQSRCALNCDPTSTLQYCDSLADCPKRPGLRMKCAKPDTDLPRWSRVCVVEAASGTQTTPR